MVQQVDEALQPEIGVVRRALARQFGHVQRQRPVRPQQAEDALRQPRLAVDGNLKPMHRRRRECQIGRLADPDRLVAGPKRLAQPRQVRMAAFDATQCLVKVETIGLGREPL